MRTDLWKKKDMRMLLGASQWGNFLSKKPDMLPVHNWINNQNGQIITSNHPEIQAEQEPLIKKWQRERRRAGSANSANSILWIPKQRVEDAQNQELPKILQQNKIKRLKSNDPHILALALASGAKLLATKDKPLIKDFKKIIGGKIYNKQKKRSETEKLLKNACPRKL